MSDDVNDEVLSGFVLEFLDDETLEIHLNGACLTTLTHDEHGWQGIQGAVDLVKSIAEVMQIPVHRLE